MKTLTMFYLDDCGYCAKARRALEELYAENPKYREIPIHMIEESREPELADQYDYTLCRVSLTGRKSFLRRTSL